MDSEAAVREFIAATLKIPVEKITRESRFAEDFGADSLTMIELVVSFEERFDVAVPEEEAQKVRTVGDVVDFLQRARTADARQAG